MKKRLLSLLLTLCMLWTLLPSAAFAEDGGLAPACQCTAACTPDALNPDCPVCGAPGARPEDCAQAAPPAQSAAEEDAAAEDDAAPAETADAAAEEAAVSPVTGGEAAAPLAAGDAHAHCYCGGALNVGDHGDGDDKSYPHETGSYQAWNGTGEIVYKDDIAAVYLSDNATLSGDLKVSGGKRLFLCLNGKTLTLSNPSRIIVEGGSHLVICDCADGGKIVGITNTTTNDPGGSVFLSGSSTMWMFGGTITGGRVKYGGGVALNDANCELILYGGSISGNSATVKGGGVYCKSGGSISIANGEISNNKASVKNHNAFGGGICFENGGLLMMGGGRIGSNLSRMGGGGVCFENGGGLALYGGSIADNTAGDSFGRVNGILSSASLGGGVYFKTSGTVSIKGGSISGNTAGHGGGLYISGDNSTLQLLSGSITGNSAIMSEGGSGGGAYLLGTSSVFISGGEISNNTVKSSNSYGVGLRLDKYSTVEMRGGEIKNNNTNYVKSSGGGIAFYGGGALALSGGKITNNMTTQHGGGVVFVEEGALYLTGGEISNNKILWNDNIGNGGGIAFLKGGTMTMADGCTISGNKGAKQGGGLYMGGAAGTVTMTGGTISGNATSGKGTGGGVCLDHKDITMTQTAGVIQQNTVVADVDIGTGGGVSVLGGTYSLSGSGAVTENKASSKGGGVYLHGNSKLNLSGGRISGNILGENAVSGSDVSGGGIAAVDGPTITMSSGTISDNSIPTKNTLSGGAAVLLRNATMKMTGGSITKNKCPVGKSAIYLTRNGTYDSSKTVSLTITGGSITDNEGEMAAVYAASSCDDPCLLKIDGETVKITGNSSTFYSSAVYIGKNCKATLGTAQISGNTASADPTWGNGAVYISDLLKNGNVTLTGGLRIFDNTNGNLYLADGKSFTALKLTADANIWVTTEKDAETVLSTAVDANYARNFHSDRAKYRVICDANNWLMLALNPTYDVTVQTDGHGTASASPTAAYMNDTVTLTATPDAGYVFKEWQVLSGGVTIVNNRFFMPAQNVTVKAIFERASYSVTVQTDGHGTASASPTAAYMNDTITLTATPDAGYVFKEWQVLSGGVTVANNRFVMPAQNVTVKAVFERITHTVTVQTDGHGTASASPVTAHINDTVTLTSTPDAGYVFKEWQVLSGGVTVANDRFVMPDSDVTVKAVFEAIDYTVTVQTDGHGIAGASPVTAHINDTVTLTSTPDAGYLFKEWQVLDGHVTISAADDHFTFVMPAENVTLKAVFEKELYRISFDANGGSVSPAGALTNQEGKLDELPSPTRAWPYSFDGWYTKKTGGTRITADTVFWADTTVYAHWILGEQFSLTVGETYYFDLSGLTLPGTADAGLPDPTLHYVPFVYAGTVEAYRLQKAAAPDEAYAAANAYAHSLFVAKMPLSRQLSWNMLDDAALIFGKDHAESGVSYLLRAPSVGSGVGYLANGSMQALPAANEWSALLAKGGISYTAAFALWGQDSAVNSSGYRSLRRSAAGEWLADTTDAALEEYAYLPVLEVLQADALGADGLQTVTLQLNGGRLGEAETVRLVVKNGEAYPAPSAQGLTRPAGNRSSVFAWEDENGTQYLPGESVPATVRQLHAVWVSYDIYLNDGARTEEITPENEADVLEDGTAAFRPASGSLPQALTGPQALELARTGGIGATYAAACLTLNNAGLSALLFGNEAAQLYRNQPFFLKLQGSSCISSWNDQLPGAQQLYLLGDGALTVDRPLDGFRSFLQSGGSLTLQQGLSSETENALFTFLGGSFTAVGQPQAVSTARVFLPAENAHLFTGSTAQDAQEVTIPTLSEEGQALYARYLAGETLTDAEKSRLSLLLEQCEAETAALLQSKAYVRIAVGYTVTLDAANGDAPAQTTVLYGDAMPQPQTPIRPGYRFDGWYQNGSAYDFSAPITDDLTLTARWIAVEPYTVTYAPGQTGTGAVQTAEKIHDAPLTLARALFTRSGWQQNGWAVADGGEKVYELGGLYTENSSVTLYPSWTDVEAPVITGLTANAVYCLNVRFTVRDNDAVASVTADGAALAASADGSYALAPKAGVQTVVVTDRSGNAARVTVTVNAAHTGGTATCTKKARCTVCGAEYGAVDPNNHTGLEYSAAVAATTTGEGHREYWHCTDCGRYYTDAEARHEVPWSALVAEKLPDTSGSSGATGTSATPDTGDNARTEAWAALLALSLAALLCLLPAKRRRMRG